MYGDFAMMVDAMIGRVLGALDDANLTGETLVIFTSDNGPVWYDADIERFGHNSAGGLRGMKADAWEAGHRMPFIARWPGKVQPDSTSEQTICFTDLLATFASMLGVNLPREAGPDSFDLLPVLLGEQPVDRPLPRSLVMASGNGTMTIRLGRWKLITALGSGGFSQPRRIEPVPDGPTGQLYDLQRDPAEQTNLFLEQPATVEWLRRQLERITSSPRSRR
jgi:arylsulfatase A-like enzyme